MASACSCENVEWPSSLTAVTPLDVPVSVPVLSKITVSARASRSMASARVTSRPSMASLVLAAACAAGVARTTTHSSVRPVGLVTFIIAQICPRSLNPYS